MFAIVFSHLLMFAIFLRQFKLPLVTNNQLPLITNKKWNGDFLRLAREGRWHVGGWEGDMWGWWQGDNGILRDYWRIPILCYRRWPLGLALIVNNVLSQPVLSIFIMKLLAIAFIPLFQMWEPWVVDTCRRCLCHDGNTLCFDNDCPGGSKYTYDTHGFDLIPRSIIFVFQIMMA